MMMPVARTEPIPCPGCGAQLNAHVPADGEHVGPDVGDYLICARCRTLLVATAFGVRRPTDVELREALQNRDVMAAIVTVEEAHRRGLWSDE